MLKILNLKIKYSIIKITELVLIVKAFQDKLLEVLPYVENVWFLYDPDRMGNSVKRIQDAVEKSDITLMAKEIHKANQVIPEIKSFKGTIDYIL